MPLLLLRHALTRRQRHLERADQPHAVVRVHSLRDSRVEPPAPAMQRAGAPFLQPLERAAEPCERGGRREETPCERSNVEAGSADHDGELSARRDRSDCRARKVTVAGRIESLVGRRHVEEVMRRALPLVRLGLRRADVHVAVDLPRVGVDDLAAETFCDVQRECALAGRGRACNHQPAEHRHGRPYRPNRRSSSERGIRRATGRPCGQLELRSIESIAERSPRISDSESF